VIVILQPFTKPVLTFTGVIGTAILNTPVSPATNELEQSNEWVKFRVKRYKLVAGVYTLLDTTDYIGVNGFTNYTDGNQAPSETLIEVLANTNISNTYLSLPTYPNNLTQYFNLLIDKPTATTTTIIVKYERIDGVVFEYS